MGYSPTPGAIDVEGLDVTAGDMAAALRIDANEWLEELPLIDDWFRTIGPKLPVEMTVELENLRARVVNAK